MRMNHLLPIAVESVAATVRNLVPGSDTVHRGFTETVGAPPMLTAISVHEKDEEWRFRDHHIGLTSSTYDGKVWA